MKLGLALAALLSAASTGATPAEWLSKPEVTGFIIGYEAMNAEQSIVERVPNGETVHNWTTMITDQRLGGLARRVSPRQFAELMASGMAENCPGGKVTKIVDLKIDQRPASQLYAECPLNPETGKPEAFVGLLIAGKDDLHSRQVAWRRLPSLADTKWAETVLAGTHLCTPGSKAKGC